MLGTPTKRGGLLAGACFTRVLGVQGLCVAEAGILGCMHWGLCPFPAAPRGSWPWGTGPQTGLSVLCLVFPLVWLAGSNLQAVLGVLGGLQELN